MNFRTEDGKEISFGYTGIIDTNEAVLKIFHQQPDSVSVPFGFSSMFLSLALDVKAFFNSITHSNPQPVRILSTVATQNSKSCRTSR